MILTAELTLYPFKEEVIPTIKEFIAKLNTYPDLKIQTFPTGTILMGEYDVVMDTLKDVIRWNYEHNGKAVILTKFLPAYESL